MIKNLKCVIGFGCNHCWHPYTGPIHMVVPEGHVIEKCCKCDEHRTRHVGHGFGNRPLKWILNGPGPRVRMAVA